MRRADLNARREMRRATMPAHGTRGRDGRRELRVFGDLGERRAVRRVVRRSGRSRSRRRLPGSRAISPSTVPRVSKTTCAVIEQRPARRRSAPRAARSARARAAGRSPRSAPGYVASATEKARRPDARLAVQRIDDQPRILGDGRSCRAVRGSSRAPSAARCPRTSRPVSSGSSIGGRSREASRARPATPASSRRISRSLPGLVVATSRRLDWLRRSGGTQPFDFSRY